MNELFKKFLHFISIIGFEEGIEYDYYLEKRKIFFNRVMFFGSFAMVTNMIGAYAFIGKLAYLNLILVASLQFSLIIHSKGYFVTAKRISTYSVYSIGILLTAYSGPDFLYHLGVLTTLGFAWVVFNSKKERIDIWICSILTVIVFFMAEYNIFNAPDFSRHPDLLLTRTLNLIVYTTLMILWLKFIRDINKEFEGQLKQTINEKDNLLDELTIKSYELEHERSKLEKVVTDRTSELLAQKKSLELKNDEKEVLLKEIHHRVKNNLQIIVSLLNLQAHKFEEPEVLKALKETQNRIYTMSLIHQRMYQTADFVAIQFKEYVDLLIANNEALYALEDHKLNYINNTPKELRIDLETAIPLGLIINELIANSFKYAFTGNNENPELKIQFETQTDGGFKLKYEDNGPGFPEGFNLENSDSLGLQLVDALTEQINGKVKYYNYNGIVYEFEFTRLA